MTITPGPQQFIVKESTPYGDFTDALYLPPETSEEEINILAQERVDNWVEAVSNPPIADEVTE